MQQNVGKLDGDDDGDLGAVTKMRVLVSIIAGLLIGLLYGKLNN
jgi:hypothetical protein